MKALITFVLVGLSFLPVSSLAADPKPARPRVSVGAGIAFASLGGFDDNGKPRGPVAAVFTGPQRSRVRIRVSSGDAVAGQVVSVRASGHVSIVASSSCHGCDVKTGDAEGE